MSIAYKYMIGVAASALISLGLIGAIVSWILLDAKQNTLTRSAEEIMSTQRRHLEQSVADHAAYIRQLATAHEDDVRQMAALTEQALRAYPAMTSEHLLHLYDEEERAGLPGCGYVDQEYGAYANWDRRGYQGDVWIRSEIIGQLRQSPELLMRMDRLIRAVVPPLAPVYQTIHDRRAGYCDLVWLVSESGFVSSYPNDYKARLRINPEFAVLNEAKEPYVYLLDPVHNPERTILWTEPYLDAVKRIWMTSCIAPVYDNDQFIGSTGIDLVVSSIADAVQDRHVGKNGYTFIMTRDGFPLAITEQGIADLGASAEQRDLLQLLLLSRKEESAIERARQDQLLPLLESASPQWQSTLRAMQRGQVGSEIIALDGAEKLAAFAPIAGLGWSVGMVLPVEEALAALGPATAYFGRVYYRGLWAFVAVLLAATALSVFLGALISVRLASPIRQLTVAAEQVSRGGDWHPPTIRTRDEIHQLAESVNRMVDAVNGKNQLLRGIFDGVHDAIFVHDAKTGAILDVNQCVADMLGVSREAIIAGGVAMISTGTAPFTEQEAMEKIHGASLQGPLFFEWLARRGDGRLIWLEVMMQAVRVLDQPLVIVSARDIDERKKAEEALRRSEEKYRAILETTTEWIWEIDLAGVHVYSNPGVERILGYPKDVFVGQSAMELMHEDDRKKVEQLLPGLIAAKEGWRGWELRWRHSDGSYRYLESNASPVLDADGNLTGYLGADRDITGRKQIEASLRESRATLNLVLDTVPMAVFWKNLEGRYLGCNRVFAHAVGLTAPDQIVGKTDFDLPWPRKDAEAYRADDREVLSTMRSKRHIIEPLLQADGQYLWIDTSKVPLLDENGKSFALLGVYEDITERRRDEQEIRSLRNYLANIIDSMPSVLVGVDPEGRITQWNQEAVRHTGVHKVDALGKPLGEVFPRLLREMETIREAVHTRQTRRENRVAYSHPSGNARYEDITVFPLIANGVEGAVIRLDDITDRVHLEQMMVQSEKMLSVGGLAAGMAHEINNPLGGMIQTAAVLEERLMTALDANCRAAEAHGLSLAALQEYLRDRNIPKLLHTIRESGSRAAAIVQNMLSFARKSDDNKLDCNISELVDRTIELARTDYDLKKKYDFKTVEIMRDYAADLPPVPCDPQKIQQVILNLLKNAADAFCVPSQEEMANEHPRITVRIRCEAQYAVLEIEDNGPGMDAQTLKRIFEPFFTTKPVNQGTGLGLSISYFIIVENHDGQINVVSEPGKGAQFIIRLPLKKEV